MSIKSCNSLIQGSLSAVLDKVDKLLTQQRVTKGPAADTLQALKTTIKEMEGELTVTDVTKITQSYLDAVDDFSARVLADAIQTVQARVNITNSLDTLFDGVKTKGGVKEKVIQFFQNRMEELSAEEFAFERAASRIFDELSDFYGVDKQRAQVLSKAVIDHLTGNDVALVRLFEKNGIAAEDINKVMFDSFKNGRFVASTEEAPELDLLVKALLKLDEFTVDRIVNKHGIRFTALKKHVFRADENYARIKSMGEEAYSDWMKKNVNFTMIFKNEISASKTFDLDKEINDWIKARFIRNTEDPSVSSARTGTNRANQAREIVFKSEEAEFEHFKLFGVQDRDIITAYIGHRKGLLLNAKRTEMMGTGRQSSIDYVKKEVAEKLDNLKYEEGDKQVVMGIIDRMAGLSGLLPKGTKEFSDLTTAGYGAASDFFSASLVTKGSLRNILLDNTMVPALIESQLTGNSALLTYLKNISTLMKGMTTDRARFDKFQKALDKMQLSTRQSWAALARGELAQLRASELNQNYGFARFARKTAEVASKWTGADATYRTARIMQAMNSAHLIKDMLGKPWKSFNGGERRFLQLAEIDEATWNNMRKLSFNKIEDTEVLPNFESLKGKGEAVGFQTQTEADKMLEAKYMNLLKAMTDTLAPRPNLHGLVAWRGAETEVGGMLTKFWGINLTQYRGLLQNMLAVNGLEAGGDIGGLLQLAKSRNGRYALGQMLSVGVGAGIAYTWTADLLSGKLPRDVSLEMVPEALSQVGFGGLYNIIGSSWFYRDDFLGTPFIPYSRLLKSAAALPFQDDPGEKAKQNLRKALHYTPGINSIFIRSAVDYMMLEGIKAQKTYREIKLEEERNNPNWWDK